MELFKRKKSNEKGQNQKNGKDQKITSLQGAEEALDFVYELTAKVQSKIVCDKTNIVVVIACQRILQSINWLTLKGVDASQLDQKVKQCKQFIKRFGQILKSFLKDSNEGFVAKFFAENQAKINVAVEMIYAEIIGKTILNEYRGSKSLHLLMAIDQALHEGQKHTYTISRTKQMITNILFLNQCKISD